MPILLALSLTRWERSPICFIEIVICCPAILPISYAHISRWIDPKSKGSAENLAMACDFLPRSFRSHDIKRPDDDDFDDDAEDDDSDDAGAPHLFFFGAGVKFKLGLVWDTVGFSRGFRIKEKREIAIKITPQSTDADATRSNLGFLNGKSVQKWWWKSSISPRWRRSAL